MFERDLFFTRALQNAKGNTILGVFGMGHIHGIKDLWDIVGENSNNSSSNNNNNKKINTNNNDNNNDSSGSKSEMDIHFREMLTLNEGLQRSIDLFAKIYPEEDTSNSSSSNTNNNNNNSSDINKEVQK